MPNKSVGSWAETIQATDPNSAYAKSAREQNHPSASILNKLKYLLGMGEEPENLTTLAYSLFGIPPNQEPVGLEGFVNQTLNGPITGLMPNAALTNAVAQAYKRMNIPLTDITVVRAQKEIGPPTSYGGRGGIFYELGDKSGYENYSSESTGGPNIVKTTLNPSNPLIIPKADSEIARTILSKFLGQEGNRIFNTLSHTGSTDKINKLALKLGLNREQIAEAITSNEGSWALADRLASQLVKRQGFDTIIINPTGYNTREVFDLTYKSPSRKFFEVFDSKTGEVFNTFNTEKEAIDYSKTIPHSDYAKAGEGY